MHDIYIWESEIGEWDEYGACIYSVLIYVWWEKGKIKLYYYAHSLPIPGLPHSVLTYMITVTSEVSRTTFSDQLALGMNSGTFWNVI